MVWTTVHKVFPALLVVEEGASIELAPFFMLQGREKAGNVPAGTIRRFT
jgi:hypothetical protein